MGGGEIMEESTILGVSVRGVLALLITVSCCALAIWVKDINVLKDLALLALGYYFGQKGIGGGNPPDNGTKTPTQQTGGTINV